MGCGGCPQEKDVPRNAPVSRKSFVVRPDGSLLFDGIAPNMGGYAHDSHNPRRLIPDIRPCKFRIIAPYLLRNGKYTVMSKCNHPDSEIRNQDVNMEICKQCKLPDLA